MKTQNSDERPRSIISRCRRISDRRVRHNHFRTLREVSTVWTCPIRVKFFVPAADFSSDELVIVGAGSGGSSRRHVELVEDIADMHGLPGSDA
jgi:hypothetical protein